MSAVRRDTIPGRAERGRNGALSVRRVRRVGAEAETTVSTNRVSPDDDHNRRKARRDKRRVPKLTKADIPPFADLPTGDQHPWRMVGRDRQIGREQCIAEGKHALVREEHGLTIITIGVRSEHTYMVFCGRCGEYAGTVREP